MKASKVHKSIGARQMKPLALSAADLGAMSDVEALRALGVTMDEYDINQMAAAHGYAMDDLLPGLLPGTIPTPLQFLQQWLPGFVHIITQARKIDDLIGIQTVGNWEDEEVVQGTVELTGRPMPYGDTTNVPLSSWNPAWERRTIVRMEEGMQVGKLEEARAGRINISSSSSKREAAALALDIVRNRIGFYGFNNGDNRTYGLLNDPSLPGYIPVVAGGGGATTWDEKTYLEITSDIRTSIAALRAFSGDTIDPESVNITLALATNAIEFLSVTSDFGNSVRDWLTKTYPRVRVVSAPEFNMAVGGENVMYLYADEVKDSSTDDGRTFAQMVPTKFQLVGVEQKAKGYAESYSNASAGVMCKRPYAVVRRVGI